MPGRTPHLTRRGQFFYFRIGVPHDLVDLIGSTELKRSLATVDIDVGRSRCRYLSTQFEQLFRTLRQMPEQSPDIVRGLVRHYFESVLNKTSYIAMSLPKDGEDIVERELNLLKRENTRFQKQIARRQYDGLIRRIAQQVLDEAQVELEDESYDRMCNGILRARVEQNRMLSAALSGDYAQTLPQDPLFNGIGLPFDPAMPWDQEEVSGVLFSEISKKYFELKSSTGAWGQKTLNDNKRVLSWFKDFLGKDLSIDSITKENFRDFRDALLKLPTHFSQHKEFEGKSFSEVTGRKKSKNAITPTTAKKYLAMLQGFLKWCANEGYIEAAPIAGITIHTKSDPAEARHPFSEGELQKIFSSPQFTGHKNDLQRSVPGSKIIKDGKYWIPIIGLYTGMRLGEIVQLLVDDVKIKDGVIYFDVAKGQDEAKKVKSIAGIRKIPVHPTLILLGFDELVLKQKQMTSSGRLFPEVKFGKDGYPSGPFSKFFSRYLVSIGVKTDKNAFHSFRHNFKDALDAADVSESRIKVLMGHSDGSVTALYGTKFKMGLLAEDLAKIDYSVDWSLL